METSSDPKQINTEIVKIKHIYFIIIIKDKSTVKPNSTDITKKVQMCPKEMHADINSDFCHNNNTPDCC